MSSYSMKISAAMAIAATGARALNQGDLTHGSQTSSKKAYAALPATAHPIILSDTLMFRALAPEYPRIHKDFWGTSFLAALDLMEKIKPDFVKNFRTEQRNHSLLDMVDHWLTLDRYQKLWPAYNNIRWRLDPSIQWANAAASDQWLRFLAKLSYLHRVAEWPTLQREDKKKLVVVFNTLTDAERSDLATPFAKGGSVDAVQRLIEKANVKFERDGEITKRQRQNGTTVGAAAPIQWSALLNKLAFHSKRSRGLPGQTDWPCLCPLSEADKQKMLVAFNGLKPAERSDLATSFAKWDVNPTLAIPGAAKWDVPVWEIDAVKRLFKKAGVPFRINYRGQWWDAKGLPSRD